ncbi:hypothetical protein Cni_G13662 [Canna indica]|uniref:Uncharacterized protein n=1 Tax=Canna indica TaxID=4628 RepID=A0AAQ3KBK6_9LILI|nr:hypothetical protein Cni_G13662 [Canna indica]
MPELRPTLMRNLYPSDKGMVGSGGDGRSSKEAVGMALHEALRNICVSSDDWTSSVFWTIRPRPYFAAPILPSHCLLSLP